MPATKKTPVKHHRCPMCGLGFMEAKAWTDHIIDCGRQRMEKQSFVCEVAGCDYATSRKSDLTRHTKRKHDVVQIAEESDSAWEDQDPGNLSDYVGVARKEAVKPKPAFDFIQLGRTVRKPTNPNPVFAPQKRPIRTEEESVKHKLDVSCTITSPESTDETCRQRESLQSTVTSPEPAIPMDSYVVSDDNNNNVSKAVLASDNSSKAPEHIDVIIRNDNTFSFNDPSQNCPPFVFGTVLQDAATQTDAPKRHHKRRRIVRTEKDGTLEEFISEEEWTDY
ncbi:hypothetical protein FSP39_023828 [Pinctada imbricata]|uniref:C2H2-type domain-containing protein n=1 Tax=Pinctada imbricata TaxID=66713 RepID=A0AA89C830_PINIB|nr:hypothetical protein FSP39_023828 [Pinctada imbricata]